MHVPRYAPIPSKPCTQTQTSTLHACAPSATARSRHTAGRRACIGMPAPTCPTAHTPTYAPSRCIPLLSSPPPATPHRPLANCAEAASVRNKHGERAPSRNPAQNAMVAEGFPRSSTGSITKPPLPPCTTALTEPPLPPSTLTCGPLRPAICTWPPSAPSSE